MNQERSAPPVEQTNLGSTQRGAARRGCCVHNLIDVHGILALVGLALLAGAGCGSDAMPANDAEVTDQTDSDTTMADAVEASDSDGGEPDPADITDTSLPSADADADADTDADADGDADADADADDVADSDADPARDGSAEDDADGESEPDGDAALEGDATADNDRQDVPVVPIDETECADGLDNDDDGETDCLDSDCALSVLCADVDGCGGCPSGTECVDDSICLYPPIETDEFEPAAMWSVITGIQIAEPVPAAERYTEAAVARGESDGVCCFDIDADGAVDNGLGSLAETLSALAGDLNDSLAEAIESDQLTTLVEFKRGFDRTNPSQLHFFSGTNDLDENGEPDQTFAQIQAGGGVFLLQRPSVDTPFPNGQLNRGIYVPTTGEYISPAEFFELNVPLQEFFGGARSIQVTVKAVRFEALLETVELTRTVNFNIAGQRYGGARMGGYIELDEFFAAFSDELGTTCGCAVGRTSGRPPELIYGEGTNPRRPTRYGFSCNDTSFDISECEAEALCDNLGLICSTVVQVISTFSIADIDTNGNGIDDAISLGLYMRMDTATIDE